ncbi:hypothetical protein DFH06DRAFT_1224308 [Mycena polygramma]|nr:hypothetical protein DFH06DRAFT_1224308 [Mycena polygramma]
MHGGALSCVPFIRLKLNCFGLACLVVLTCLTACTKAATSNSEAWPARKLGVKYSGARRRLAKYYVVIMSPQNQECQLKYS